jgi:c-di-GMP-binding flagellar brake protein YcgR
MKKWSGSERRRASRIKYPCLVKIFANTHYDNEIILTHVENISVGGVCIQLQQQFEMDLRIGLEIDLLDSSPNIRCKGKIVHSVESKKSTQKEHPLYEIGVEFFGLDSEDEKRIEEVIRNMLRKQGRF